MTLDLDPDRRLALAYVPAARRAALEALWRLDVTLGSVLATGREPLISQIRLAWWREALEKLDREPPPAEPVLEARRATSSPPASAAPSWRRWRRAGRRSCRPSRWEPDELQLYAAARGGRLFALSARLLGADEPGVAAAGEAWALVDLARRSGNPAEAERRSGRRAGAPGRAAGRRR